MTRSTTVATHDSMPALRATSANLQLCQESPLPFPPSILVTGTDTGVGKTWISQLLVGLLACRGRRVGVYKPACSGADRLPDGSLVWQDVELLHAAFAQQAESRQPLAATTSATFDGLSRDDICPQRFAAPLAPPEAARLEGRTVDSQLLRTGIQVWQDRADMVVVEGAGGLLCPLTDNETVADLAVNLQSPLILVAANRLGVINHTLLTLQVAHQRGLQVLAVVLNNLTAASGSAESGPLGLPEQAVMDGAAPMAVSPDLSRRFNARCLQSWLPAIPLFECEYQSTVLLPINTRAQEFPWDSLRPA